MQYQTDRKVPSFETTGPVRVCRRQVMLEVRSTGSVGLHTHEAAADCSRLGGRAKVDKWEICAVQVRSLTEI